MWNASKPHNEIVNLLILTMQVTMTIESENSCSGLGLQMSYFKLFMQFAGTQYLWQPHVDHFVGIEMLFSFLTKDVYM